MEFSRPSLACQVTEVPQVSNLEKVKLSFFRFILLPHPSATAPKPSHRRNGEYCRGTGSFLLMVDLVVAVVSGPRIAADTGGLAEMVFRIN